MCSSDQSLVIVAFLWEKLSQPQFYKELTRKTAFFEGLFWFKFNNLGLALGKNLKFYTSLAKGLKVKVRKFLGLIPTFVEVTGKKLVGVNNIECFKTMHSLDFIKNISCLGAEKWNAFRRPSNKESIVSSQGNPSPICLKLLDSGFCNLCILHVVLQFMYTACGVWFRICLIIYFPLENKLIKYQG